jgi:hypothetical protein
VLTNRPHKSEQHAYQVGVKHASVKTRKRLVADTLDGGRERHLSTLVAHFRASFKETAPAPERRRKAVSEDVPEYIPTKLPDLRNCVRPRSGFRSEFSHQSWKLAHREKLSSSSRSCI